MYHGKKKKPKGEFWLTVWWSNKTVNDYNFTTDKQRTNFYKKNKDRIESTLPSIIIKP